MKPRPILSDMPRHIKQKIVDFVWTRTNFRLRQCSKDLKTVAENSPVYFYCLAINVKHQYIQIGLEFERTGTGTTFHAANAIFDSISSPKNHVVEREDFVDGAVEHLMNTVRIGTISLENLVISLSDNESTTQEFLMKLAESLAKVGKKVHVKRVIIDQGSFPVALDTLLLQFQNKKLENINFTGPPSDSIILCAETEQWKQAKRLSVKEVVQLPFVKLQHFKFLKLKIDHLNLDMVQRCVKNFLENPNCQNWEFQFSSSDQNVIDQYLEQFQLHYVWRRIPVPGKSEGLRVHMLHYFQIEREF